ncbi:MAG: hypothetical protein C4334_07920 [Pyrinomonas sp.]|uniref:MtnX-like HAD-IB family phosphatase n=1 Tax=Pyrinomonas sp. TaxID=2080306 RepID=UPI00332252F0
MKDLLFIDFDGTITRRDVTDAILEAFAAPQWRAIEEDWQAGRIGSRDCLHGQMSLVRASRDELEALLCSIELDPGLGALLEVCATDDLPVHIVSDGFDYCIERILARERALAPLLRRVRVWASHLEPDGHRWRTTFPFSCHPLLKSHGCATCKPMVMRLLNRTGARTIFIGDGLSDIHATGLADQIFAKDKLADFCAAHAVSFIRYANLAEVAAHLAARNNRQDEQAFVELEVS